MMAPAEMVDPEEFGTLVASNHGFRYSVFTDEEEAVAWLRALP